MDEKSAMMMAITTMHRSKTHGASDPLVGAILVSAGQYIAQEHTPLGHAEYLLLDRLDKNVTSGATLYTTLEPCTFRGINKEGEPKIPCVDSIVDKEITRVVIGMLDPNPYILGNGVLRLREHGVEVSFFPPPLMAEIERANLLFRKAFGLSIEEEEQTSEMNICGRWIVTTSFEDGSKTHEELHIQQRIGNRYYGVMWNHELNQKYDFFMIKMGPRAWNYSVRSKYRAKHLDHGAGVIYFDNNDCAHALGAARGAFSKTGETGIQVSVVMKRAST